MIFKPNYSSMLFESKICMTVTLLRFGSNGFGISQLYLYEDC